MNSLSINLHRSHAYPSVAFLHRIIINLHRRVDTNQVSVKRIITLYGEFCALRTFY